MAIEFGVLGEIGIRVDGQEVDPGPARQRCVLALLLTSANKVVPSEQLIDRLWDGSPPYRARGTLASHVSRIRTLLRDNAFIHKRASGYVLSTDPGNVDMLEFRRLVHEARSTRRPMLLQQALDLWHGDPFTGTDCAWLTNLGHTLRRERLAAQLDLVDAKLSNGRHAELLPELIDRADSQPLDERVAGQLMLALYRSGRQADALLRYQRVRIGLAEELGADPSPALESLHYKILRISERRSRAAGYSGGAGPTS